jgi:hypothetical protein
MVEMHVKIQCMMLYLFGQAIANAARDVVEIVGDSDDEGAGPSEFPGSRSSGQIILSCGSVR